MEVIVEEHRNAAGTSGFQSKDWRKALFTFQLVQPVIYQSFCCASKVCQTLKGQKYSQNPLSDQLDLCLFKRCRALISPTGEMLNDLHSVTPNNTTNQVQGGIFTSRLDVLATLDV